MKTTVYIPSDKEQMYERAKQELGESISATFVRCLERELEARELATQRIVVEVYDGTAHRISRKAFEGRWIVGDDSHPEEHHWSEQSGARWAGSPDCAVAQTKKGALVVLSDYSDDQWKGWAVFNSFEELRASEQYPDSLVAAVADVLDIDHIEELDI